MIWATLHDRGPGEQPGPTQPEVAPTQPEVAAQPRPVAAAPPVIFRGHTGAVHTLAFDANSNEVLSGGDDEDRPPLEPGDRRHRSGTRGSQSPARTTWCSLRTAVGFSRNSSVRKLYDTTTRAKVLDYPDPGNPHLGGSAFSANGKRIVMGKASVAGDVFAAVWDLDSNGRLSSPLHPGLQELAVVALSPDGKRGASATTGNTAAKEEGVRVWEVITKKELDEMIALVKKKEAGGRGEHAAALAESPGAPPSRSPRTGSGY